MLNYFERLDSYKRRNYFQINGTTLDVYVPTLPQWSQNLDVVKDILMYTHDIDIADAFGILTIRLTGTAIEGVELASFEDTLKTANQVLSGALGSAEVWESIKPDGAPSRVFLAIIINQQKPKPDDAKDQTTTRRPKTVRVVPPDTEPV
jgi:hypothetical protein